MSGVDYQSIIDRIYCEVKAGYGGIGKQADYIPILGAVDASKYGVAVVTVDGNVYKAGDCDVPFSIQSISKVFTLAMVQQKIGDDLWKFVGREPSGTPFNSLVQLEHENGVPRNPFINAGALVIADKMMDLYADPKSELLNFVQLLSGSKRVEYDAQVAQSEFRTAHRNLALVSFMKSFGNITNDLDTILDNYCHQCSITMTCEELAKSVLFLANKGVNPVTGNTILSLSPTKRLGALMLTCGLYDESGDYAFRVGIPGKSGVGGGIVAFIPGELAIAVWSPRLNSYGNSVMGVETLERFTTYTGRSIF